MDDVLTKMKSLKDQIKQMSEDQSQVIDILKSIAENQASFKVNKYFLKHEFLLYDYVDYDFS